MKKIIKIFLLFILNATLILSGCEKPPVQTVPDVTTAEADAATTNYIALYGDLFKAKKALLEMTDLPFTRSYYTAQSLTGFERITNEINSAANKINEENINLYFFDLEHAVSFLEFNRSSVPVIYITTQQDIDFIYRTASVAVLDNADNDFNQTITVDLTANIELRGNSTSGAPKKPYNIQFTEKQALLGMDSGRKWVLLANALDKTLMRNKLVFDFCSTLNMSFVPQAEYAEVWLNGIFLGSYLLTEAVTDGKNRVDIDVKKNEFLMELESDRKNKNETYVKSPSGVRLKIKKPDDLNDTQKKYLTELLSAIEKCLENGSDEDLTHWIDIESFVDFYVFMELFKDIDAYFSSTFFYIKNDILYAGPPWDLDLISGNVSPAVDEVKYKTYCNTDGFGTNSSDSTEGIWMQFGWFKMLFEHESFKYKVIRRFNQLQPMIVNLYDDNELGKNRIDALLNKYSRTFTDNYASAGWSITEAYSPYERIPDDSFEKNVEFLRSWLRGRNKWLMEYFSTLS